MKLGFRRFLSEEELIHPSEIAALKKISHITAQERAKESRSLGLKHVGWGYYKNKQGQITHKTERNLLTPVEPGEKESITDYLKQKKQLDRRRKFAKAQESSGDKEFVAQSKKKNDAEKALRNLNTEYDKATQHLEKHTDTTPLSSYEFHDFLHDNKLEIKTPDKKLDPPADFDQPKTQAGIGKADFKHGYIGPKGSNKVTHYFKWRHSQNWDGSPILRTRVAELSAADREAMSKEDLTDPKWQKGGEHHPIDQKRKMLDDLQNAYHKESKKLKDAIKSADKLPSLAKAGLSFHLDGFKSLKPKVLDQIRNKAQEYQQNDARAKWWDKEHLKLITKHLSKSQLKATGKMAKGLGDLTYGSHQQAFQKLSPEDKKKFEFIGNIKHKAIRAASKNYDEIYDMINSSSSQRRMQDTKNLAFHHYVKTAAKQNLQLDRKELNSLAEYTDTAYRPINQLLAKPGYAEHMAKDYDKGPDAVKDHVDHIKNIDSAMKKHTVDKHLTVYRGLSQSQVASMKLHDLKTTHFQSPAYMSTSLKSSTAANFSSGGANHMLVIRVPKGSHGLWVDPISRNQGEHELLLPRDSKFRISKVHSPNGKGLRVEAELLPHDFKGMKPLPTDPSHPYGAKLAQEKAQGGNKSKVIKNRPLKKKSEDNDPLPWDDNTRILISK